ncbi:hypothetical protein V8C86DRAFT_1813438 [Haematococcus lacustris]
MPDICWPNICWPKLICSGNSFLTRALTSAMERPAASQQLNAVLDQQPMQLETTCGDDRAYEDDMMRQRAEARAEDAVNRLRVAQEQLSEWAGSKARDAQTSLGVTQQLLQLLKESNGSSTEPAVAQLLLLQEQLQQSALEATALAREAQADADKLKRSSHKAGIEDDIEMKRHRDSASDADGDATESAEVGLGATAVNKTQSTATSPIRANGTSTSFAERARYIPMRLEAAERRLLRLLEAALNVSEYTDKVDVLVWRHKTARIHTQIKDICAILSGLVVAQDYRKGQELVRDREFAANADFFQAVFEVGRRYKIMNPDKMRSEYGKLMYLLMDSADPAVQDLLEFKCVKPLKTVASFLEERGAGALLEDGLMTAATAEIVSDGRQRYDVQRDIKVKERARDALAKKYCNSAITKEEILTAIYSFSDNNSYLLFNRDPIDRMITYFTTFFSPQGPRHPDFSLAIQGGKGGARLTHNHERQYHYVLQSLTLWREVSTDMFKAREALWYLAEADLLREGNSYRLTDTGQGLNRVQPAPCVSRAMHGILARCQERIGTWVGSSVVHLGDHNVPNALMFMDKYIQVPRILNPVVLVLDELPKLYRDPEVKLYIDSAFGSVEHCQLTIMTDFCRHAFDGSGADNFFDAGSCVDGRLTSAWNWCARLEKKPYFHVFRLCGFTSFDGDFK